MGYDTYGWLQFENGTVLTGDVRLLLTIPISVYGALLLLAGSFGNFGLAYVIICDRRRLNKTTRVMFSLLAGADTLVLWTAVLRYCIRVTVGWDFRVAHPVVCRIHVLAVYVSTNWATAVFCILCVDRCFVIYYSLEGYRTHFVGPNSGSAVSQISKNAADSNLLLTHSRLRTAHRSRHHSRCFLLSMRLFKCTRVRRLVNRLLCCVHPCTCLCTKPTVREIHMTGTGSNLRIDQTIESPNIKSISFSFLRSQHSQSMEANNVKDYGLQYSSPLENIVSELSGNNKKGKIESLFERMCSVYSRHSCRWLTVGLVLGSITVVIKHLVAYRYVRIESVRGCYGNSVARWRDYMDFVTQAIVPYFIIIPANAWVYRAIKRHQQMLTALRASIGFPSCSSAPGNISDCQNRACQMKCQCTKLINTGTKYSFRNDRPTEVVAASPLCAKGSRYRHISAKCMVAAATHLSKGHLFVFKTLITLSILHFVINLPGHLYAQVILPSLSDWWFCTVEGHLLYDSLFLVSHTNNGASFFILLCTVRGFRLRVRSVFKRSCLGRLLSHIWRSVHITCSAILTGRRLETTISRQTTIKPVNDSSLMIDLQLSQMKEQRSCSLYAAAFM